MLRVGVDKVAQGVVGYRCSIKGLRVGSMDFLSLRVQFRAF